MKDNEVGWLAAVVIVAFIGLTLSSMYDSLWKAQVDIEAMRNGYEKVAIPWHGLQW